MDRRSFLKLAGVTGFSVASAPMFGQALAFDGESSGGGPLPAPPSDNEKLFVMVQASGGWDPTLLCDPKPNLNNTYAEGDIGQAGQIRYAPIGAETDTFFQTHYQKMLVINGIDGKTNSHDAGRRHTASGRLAEGYPCLAAVSAGLIAPELPMSFLTFGGYERTAGLVAPTRNLSNNKVAELAHPHRINFTQENSPTYHSDHASALISLARGARTEQQIAKQRLPRYVNSMDTLMTARMGADQLKQLEEVLPEPAPDGDQQRIQLMIASMRAGICVAGQLVQGGFDTHDSHDANHIPRLNSLCADVDYLLLEAERQGVADRLVVVMCSDFGRTPTYNDGAGKDHWPVTSMIVLGQDGVPGNKVIGESDEGHNAMNFDPITLEPVGEEAEDSVRIGPDHVHKNVRRIMGIEGSDVDEAFPIHVEHDLDFLA